MRTEFYLFANTIKENINILFAIILAFLAPIKPLIIIVGAMIFLDTIFGIMRALKVKEKITSRRLARIVSKMALYQSTIILFFCVEKFILGDMLASLNLVPLLLTKIVAILLIFVEFLSITENYESISGNNIWEKAKDFLTRTSEIKNKIKDNL